MASDWQQIRLGKVCLKIGSGATPRGGKDAYRGGNTALIRSQNIYNDLFSREGLAYINDSQAHELRNVVVEKNDVLLNITGDSVARCCQVDPDVLPARVNQHVAIIRTQPDVLDSRFLRYVLVSPSMQDHLLALASAGATRNALTKAMIESLDIQAPLIEEQRAIAHILGTLDDKIQNLREQNETLEAMARALFKAWFVDFEPVRAKLEGRWQRGQSLPGLPAHLYDLFPDRLVESELGEIPEGWCVEELSAHLDVLETGRRPKGGVGGIIEGVPSVGAESIIGVGRFEFGKTKYVSEEFFAAMKSGHAESMDVMLYKDGGKPGDFRPRVSMFGRGFPFDRYAINEHVFRMRSKSLGQVFLYLQVSHERILFDLRNRGGKAAIPGINQSDVKTLLLVVPRPDVLAAFDKAAFPMMEGILERAVEGRSLAQLRDTLLPKLISGELRVPDAQAFVKEHC